MAARADDRRLRPVLPRQPQRVRSLRTAGHPRTTHTRRADRLGLARPVRGPLQRGRRRSRTQPRRSTSARAPRTSARPDHRPRLTVDPAEHDAVVTAFLAAVRAGDLRALIGALDPDATLTSDGGGAVSAARRPVHGSDHVARLILGITGTTAPEIRLLIVNGLTGLALVHRGELYALVSLTTGTAVERVDIILNPDKLPTRRHP